MIIEAQPRNLVGGHILSVLAGVLCFQIFGKVIWVAAALAVSVSIALMLATKTLHIGNNPGEGEVPEEIGKMVRRGSELCPVQIIHIG